jgi:ArsR family transcriptional regulator
MVSYSAFRHQTASHLGSVGTDRKCLSEPCQARSMRDVYSAVADPTRRRLLRMLAEFGELPLHDMTAHFAMGRTAISKHLAILKEAGLVIDHKEGRETRYQLNAAPLQEIGDWLAFYDQFWTVRISHLKDMVEGDIA